MVGLSTIPLPLSPNGPPPGYGWGDRDISVKSTTTTFITKINDRDTFLGLPRCIVCGMKDILQQCNIIRQSELEVWIRLKERNWVPEQAKHHPQHEQRAGLLMCLHHQIYFDNHYFFIRYSPDIRRFVFVNYSGYPDLQQFHGKAIALDINDHRAPFPSLFIIHEMRVRGFHPFEPTEPTMPDEVLWQDWVCSDSVFDSASNSFKRDKPPGNPNSLQQQPTCQPATMSVGGASSGGRKVALNADVITEILAATHAMPSWKACQMEGTSWAGSAEENIQTYVSSIGVEDLADGNRNINS